MIYYVEGAGKVKIGVTNNVRQRYCALCAGSPVPLRLVAVEEGGPVEERSVHHRFRIHWHHSEWFHYEGSLRDIIESITPHPMLDKWGAPPQARRPAAGGRRLVPGDPRHRPGRGRPTPINDPAFVAAFATALRQRPVPTNAVLAGAFGCSVSTVKRYKRAVSV